MSYQTFTNDPIILGLIEEIKAAQEKLSKANLDYEESLDMSVLAGAEHEVQRLETRLASALITALELSKGAAK